MPFAAVDKIRAAVKATGDRHLVIVAGTDSVATHGVQEVIRRGNLYSEAGADASLVDAPTSKEEPPRIVSGTKAPVSANMIEGGKTPLLTSKSLKRWDWPARATRCGNIQRGQSGERSICAFG